MTTYSERVLDQRANAYLLEVVDYPTSFAQALLHQLDLQTGQIHTSLPVAALERDLYDFESGGVASLPDLLGQAVRAVQQFLAGDVRRVFLVEYRGAQRNDPWIIPCDLRLPIVFAGADVYFLLCHNDAHHRDVLELALRRALGVMPPRMAIGVGACLPTPLAPIERLAEIEQEFLHAVATHACWLLVSAYDGEGFVLWSRHDVPPPILHQP